MNLFTHPNRTRRRRRGATLVEMAVASAVFAFISIFIAFLVREVALQTRRSLNFVPDSGDSHRMMDRIRDEILGAEIMSCIVYNENNGISYKLPSRASASAIWFDDGEMFYRETADAADVEWGDVNDFTIAMPDVRTFTITLVADTKNRNDEDITLTYQDTITLRN